MSEGPLETYSPPFPDILVYVRKANYERFIPKNTTDLVFYNTAAAPIVPLTTPFS